MNNIVNLAIDSVTKSKTSFCKFISANDAGKTGAHQEGFYIPKNSIPLMFDSPRPRGKNDDKFITVKWQNDIETNSRFIYYGQGTRNEYRLTRFGKGFPFLTDDHVGDLFILSHIENDYYEGFVLEADEDIEDFFAAFNISSAETNRLIPKQSDISHSDLLSDCFKKYISVLKKKFPSTTDLSATARNCYNGSYKITDQKVEKTPDDILLKWLDAEFDLFKLIELEVYSDRISSPFSTIDELIEYSNTILNRRKSRAGKSLEHQLAEVFSRAKLNFEVQAKTEDNKRPDFLFPNSVSYHDKSFNPENLVFLAAKTTCKDRWRQILNEADRISVKNLFTLQQGISKNQLSEMYKYNVRLVVPKPYISSFPEEYRNQILSLEMFLSIIKEKQFIH